RRQRRQRLLDRRAVTLQPRRQHKSLAEARGVFIDGEAGTVGRELEIQVFLCRPGDGRTVEQSVDASHVRRYITVSDLRLATLTDRRLGPLGCGLVVNAAGGSALTFDPRFEIAAADAEFTTDTNR